MRNSSFVAAKLDEKIKELNLFAKKFMISNEEYRIIQSYIIDVVVQSVKKLS